MRQHVRKLIPPPATDDPVFMAVTRKLRKIHPGRMQQSVGEIAEFYRLAKQSKARTYLEVGCASGASLYIMAHALAEPGLVCGINLDGEITREWRDGEYNQLRTDAVPVDVARAARDPRLTAIAANLTAEGYTVLIIDGNSHDTTVMDQARAFFGEAGVDVCFLDGDDDLAGARLDWNIYAPLVNRGGLIGLHDIATRCKGWGPTRRRFGVRLLWAEILKITRTRQWNMRPQEKGIGVALVPRHDEPRWWVI